MRLTPFSLETLEHFIHLERPQGIAGEDADADAFAHPTEYDREEAYHGAMPSVQDYLSVGRLYEAIEVNLRATSRRLGESVLFIGPKAGQLEAELGLEGVVAVTDLASAITAVHTIVEQGEGAPNEREGSHYQRFQSMRREYLSALDRDPAFGPAWPAASNPVMRRPPTPEDKVFIDDPASARVLDFANATYALLLRLLVQSFGRVDERAGAMFSAAVALMHIVREVGEALATMPASAACPSTNAGMTFTMLRGVEPLAAGPVEVQLLGELFDELADAAAVAAQALPRLDGCDRKIRTAREVLTS